MEMILLGYDGSRAADSALEWIAERLHHADGRVQVVAVTNMFLSQREDTRRMLDTAARRLIAAAPGVSVETHFFDGVMPGTLIEAARGADLLVVGVDTAHPLREAVHGWRALRTSARSPQPTVIVPSGWTGGADAVTVGLDDDESSDAAVAFAATEAERAGVALRLLHSWRAETSASEEAGADAHHRALLARAAARVRAAHAGLRIVTETAHSNPVSALTAASARSALVVVGTHGRGILAGGFIGSTTQDLIGSVGVPLCVVPPVREEAVAVAR